MPYKNEKQGLLIPSHKDKRKKLTEQDKQNIKELKQGMSHKELIEYFWLDRQIKISKRTIQFICNPASHKANLERRAARGGSRQYYDKDYHRQSMAKCRQHRKQLDAQGLLIAPIIEPMA